jgi:hypothetical protein
MTSLPAVDWQSKGGGSAQFDATVYNITSTWIERRRQKMLKELGIGVDGEEISEDDMLKELRQRVESELRLDYLVTGSKVPLVNPQLYTCTNNKVQMVVES